ncbi:MAG: hypothetical protein GY760_16530 [Deltaproteobacteria bacterium]|nr:hypothetical protein [Deltaproteobacteria bacterium]
MINIKKIVLLSALLITIFILNGCPKIVHNTTVYMKPVYLSFDDLYKSFRVEQPKELINPGKIYIKDKFIFVNDKKLGIHIIDNSNPVSPKNLAFLKILGNHDLAIKGHILYADSYNDLLAIDISNLNNDISKIKVVKRIRFVFPSNAFMGGRRLDLDPHGGNGYLYEKADPAKGIVIDWVEWKRTTSTQYIPYGAVLRSRSPSGGSSTGTGGSMSRFALFKNRLYTVDNSDMHIFDINNPALPVHLSKFRVGQFIETLFLHKNHLFIGSETGCYIYTGYKSGTSNLISRSSPSIISQLPHVRAKDPVVVRGKYAYVTLGNNQLHVIDISMIKYPTLVRNYNISSPFGLTTDANYLYVCNQGDGLVIYDTNEPRKLKIVYRLKYDNPDIYKLLNNYRNYSKRGFYDVILDGGKIIAVGDGGLFQLKFDDMKLKLISTIKSQYKDRYREYPHLGWQQ